MAQFRVDFDCDNDAFHGYLADGVADVLLAVSKQVRRHGLGLKTARIVVDANGNTIGKWQFSACDDLNS